MKTGNVSFGYLYVQQPQPKRISKFQDDVETLINRVFEGEEEIEEIKDYSNNGRNLDVILEEDMGMNVCIKHTNGNVEVNLRTNQDADPLLKNIINKEDKIGLCLDKSKDLSDIKTLIINYAKNCFNIAKRYSKNFDDKLQESPELR